jgi:hypothetical protein
MTVAVFYKSFVAYRNEYGELTMWKYGMGSHIRADHELVILDIEDIDPVQELLDFESYLKRKLT